MVIRFIIFCSLITLSINTMEEENFNSLSRSSSSKSPEPDFDQYTLGGKFKHFSIIKNNLPDRITLFPHFSENWTPTNKVLHVISSLHIENAADQKTFITDVLNGITYHPKQGTLFITAAEKAIIEAYKKHSLLNKDQDTQTHTIESPIIRRAYFKKTPTKTIRKDVFTTTINNNSSWISQNPKKFAFFVGLGSLCATLGLQWMLFKWYDFKLFENKLNIIHFFSQKIIHRDLSR